MNRLVFVDAAFLRLRERLLSSSAERAAFVYAKAARTPQGYWRLIAETADVVEDSDYSHQTSDSLEIPSDKVASAIRRARQEGLSIVLTHTHPWDGIVSPSPTDLTGESVLLPRFFSRVSGVPHGRLILGRRMAHGCLFESPTSEASLSVKRVGRDLLDVLNPDPTDSPDEMFDRQMRALGIEGQHSISRTTVAIIGLGGTGSVVAQNLAHLGVNAFILIDPDKIDDSNLSRVVGSTRDDVGRYKVDASARMISSINPKATVLRLARDVSEVDVGRHLLDADFFFCCTDSHGSRAILNQLSYQFLLPGIDLGVRIDVLDRRITHAVGRVQMLAPGLACLSCSGVLDPQQVRRDLETPAQRARDPYFTGATVRQPAVISINSETGGAAINMFLSAVAGAPFASRNQVFFFDRGTTRSIDSAPDVECSVCSTDGFLARGDLWPMPGRPTLP